MNYPDPIPAATRQHLDGLHARSTEYATAHAVLFAELHDALTSGTTEANISTPAGPARNALACDVVADDIGCTSGRPALLELLAIVGCLADMTDQEAPRHVDDMRRRAKAWITARAQEHADFHASDLAVELRDAAADADEGPEWEPDMEMARRVF